MTHSLAFQHNYADFMKPEGFRQSVYSLLLATLSINILSLALPVTAQQVYNRVLPNPETGTLSVLIVGVCVAVVLELILRLCRAYTIGRSGAAYEHRMACIVMRRMLNADLSEMEYAGIGEHLQRMGSVSRIKDFYSGYALTVLAELAFVPFFLGLIVYISGPLAAIPIALLAAFAVISIWDGYNLRIALRDRERSDNLRFNFLIESLEGIHTLKAFALEKFFERRYESLEEDSTIANYRVTQRTAGTFNTGAIFSHLMAAGVISAGSWLVLNGMLTTGALIATLLLSGRMMQPVQKTLALWARYQDFLLAKQHIEKILATPQQKIASRNVTKHVPGKGIFNFCNVSFQYGNSGKALLENINLDIAHGDIISISGVHGSGKTTILDLAAGIYPPSRGGIFIDGQNIGSYKPEELAHYIGYIRTRPLIFRGTIRDNITCFGQIDEAQAIEISSFLHVDRDVAKLPSGFDTALNGNNTDSISHGLKQRISIARALASRPGLILFDNADRALDKEGYTLIYSLLARLKGKVSMILVTDDRNLSALADRHYKLENGLLFAVDALHTRSNIHPYRELPL